MEAKITKANLGRLTKGDKDELLRQVTEEIDKSSKVLATWKRNLSTYYELYMMCQRNKHYEGLANIFVPEILRAVETIVGQLYQTIVGSPEWFLYSGRDTYDSGDAIAMTQLVHYEMDENSFKARLMDSLRQMVISGLTVRKILWDFEEVARRRTDNEESEVKDEVTGKTRKVRKLINRPDIQTIKDTWTFEPVDLIGFHISDITTPYNNIQKAEWIAEQYIVPKNYAKARVKKGWFADTDLVELERYEAEAKPSDYKNLRDGRAVTSGYQAYPVKDHWEIIERWGLLKAKYVYTADEIKALKLEDDDLVEAVIIIANRRGILKLEPNPFWHGQKPYVACPYVPKENELPGLGVGQIGQKLQEELNDTRNQVMDNKTLILMCMWLKHRASGIKNQELRVRPSGVIQTNDMNGLEALRPPVVTGLGVNIEGVIKNDLRESVGASSNLQGIAQSGVGTATESAIINKQSLGRLLMTAELYGELILKPTLVFAEYLNYQFYDHEKVIKVIGPTGVKYRKLRPEEIAGHKNVVIRISTDIADSPVVRRQQNMNFLQIMMSMPPQAIEYHWKLLNKIYKEMFDGHSLDELYAAPASSTEDTLTPEDEVDCVLAEHQVYAKPNQDHQKYLEYLIQEFNSYKYSLTPTQFEMFKTLIMSHQKMMEDQLIEQQAQQAMMMEAQMQGSTPGGGKQAGASPSTQTAKIAPSVGGIRQQQGI